ncbi:hypothetical protein V8F33_000188 [Rhypophila sp. PSN 637]
MPGKKVWCEEVSLAALVSWLGFVQGPSAQRKHGLSFFWWFSTLGMHQHKQACECVLPYCVSVFPTNRSTNARGSVGESPVASRLITYSVCCSHEGVISVTVNQLGRREGAQVVLLYQRKSWCCIQVW